MAESTRGEIALADSAERSLELLLTPYLTSGPDQSVRLSETEFRQISTGLSRMGKDSWSRVPRIYTVLRMINHVQVIDSFLSEGVSDIWFPFSHQTLPQSLRSASARFEFLKLQDLVLTKALDLEREDGKHRHFSKLEDVPLQKVEELGKGGFGYVDRVVSTITYKEYARKLIPRGRTFKKNIEVLRDFERELGHLKKMSHIHIVELIGSYTDPRFVGILMSPVADCNLKDFLAREPLPSGERSFLRTFFGCLASALCYLHQNTIRHKDIKPQNVLVKGHQVFLTDFGISLDWSELGQSTTTGVTVKTPRYCAPEVAGYLPRNSLSDLWSLGCVFLEIWTVLKGETIDALLKYLECQGSNSTCYYLNYDSSLEWCRILEGKTMNTEENPPLSWIRGILQLDQENRWTAQTLVDRIQEANDNPDYRYTFSGICCIGEYDSMDSDHYSKRASMALQETISSPVEVYIPKSRSTKHEVDTELLTTNPSSSLTIRPSKMLESDQAISKSRWVFGKAIGVSETTTSTSTRPKIMTNERQLAPETGISPITEINVGDRPKDLARNKPVSSHTSAVVVEKMMTSPEGFYHGVPEPVAGIESYIGENEQEPASKSGFVSDGKEFFLNLSHPTSPIRPYSKRTEDLPTLATEDSAGRFLAINPGSRLNSGINEQSSAKHIPQEREGAPHNRLTSIISQASTRPSLDYQVKPSSFSAMRTSVESTESPSQRRLEKRRNVLKELVDTEHTYERDMRVLLEIYKATAIVAITNEDIRIIFGNAELVREFAHKFLTLLREVVKPVYVRKSDRRTGGTSASMLQISTASIDAMGEKSNVEKDVETKVGHAFEIQLDEMEKVYLDYIRTRHAANKRLEALQSSPAAREWLKECYEQSSDITRAGSLSALLVEPVRRITKYPVLVHQLLEATPDTHPDIEYLQRAFVRLTNVQVRINEVEKHTELLDQVNSSKTLSRRFERLRQYIDTTEIYEDSEYSKLKSSYDNNITQLLVVKHDCQRHVEAIESWVLHMCELAVAVEGWIDLGYNDCVEIERKLRQFVMLVRGINSVALPDHKYQVARQVLHPMEITATMLERFRTDAKGLIHQRENRLLEYNKFKSKRDRGGKLDKKMIKQMEQWEALNLEAKERMKRLLNATADLVKSCQANLVELHLRWLAMCQQKLAPPMGISLDELDKADIVKDWQGEFDYYEASDGVFEPGIDFEGQQLPSILLMGLLH